MTISLGRSTKVGAKHPFAKKDPKPTRARLVSLLDPLGRRRYSEVERFLAMVSGATSGLHYFNATWGWAVRYMIGAKTTLCVLHLLPNTFEATVMLGKEMDEPLKNAEMTTEMKRRLSRAKMMSGVKAVRMPIKNDGDYAGFQALIRLKAEALRSKKPKAPEEKTDKPEKAAKAEKPAKAKAAK